MTTTVNQLTAGGRFPHEDCEEACEVSVLTDVGHPDSVANVEAFNAADHDNPSDGSGGLVIIDRLSLAGVPSHLVQGEDWHTTVSKARSAGLTRVFVAIMSTSYGYPWAPGVPHWILWAGSTEFMQPVGGHLANYSDDLVASAQQRYCVVVDRPIAVGSLTVVNAAMHGSIPTYNAEMDMDIQQVAAEVKSAYDIAEVCRAVRDGNKPRPSVEWEDATQPAAFNDQVTAVMQGRASMHDVYNSIQQAVYGGANQ